MKEQRLTGTLLGMEATRKDREDHWRHALSGVVGRMFISGT